MAGCTKCFLDFKSIAKFNFELENALPDSQGASWVEIGLDRLWFMMFFSLLQPLQLSLVVVVVVKTHLRVNTNAFYILCVASVMPLGVSFCAIKHNHTGDIVDHL